MARSVTAHGRSGQTVTASSTRTETTISVSGGGSGKTVNGRPRRNRVSGIGAATLIIFMAAHAASSPPLGVDVTGTASGTFAMSAAGQGSFAEAYTGTGAATIGALSGSAAGVVTAPVTGTGAATLAIFSGTGVGSGSYPSGAGDATLVLTSSGAGQHIFPVTAAGASVLALTASAAGRADQLVSGVAQGVLALAAAAAGTAGDGPSTPVPASIATPVQGTDLTAVWNLQFAGTGPRASFSNGTWAGSLDAYLIGKGFVIGNDNGALWLDVGSSTVTVANYKFLNTPRIQVCGSGTVNFDDCTFDFTDTGGVTGPRDIKGTPTGALLTVNFNYCSWNITGSWNDSGTANYYHNRWSNQVQNIWGGGATILIQDAYVTGGGVNPPASSHVELIQYNAASPHTFTIRRGMINFIDGQASLSPTSPNYGWTGVVTGPGGGAITLEDTIVIGITEIDANPLNPNRMGCTVQYDNATPVTISNCVLQRATFGYTLNGSSGAARPTVSGNRTFANAALVLADFG